jgi:5-methyltetrahydropteroyltriglutamate--homocysteine methyltransferase
VKISARPDVILGAGAGIQQQNMITAHADVVGSLLRPPWLLEAQERLCAGQITRPAYKSIEDRAVHEAVAQQEEAGLTVLTDGEMRRLSFQSQMVQAVEGFGEWDIGAFLWGHWYGHEEVGDSRRERPKDLGVVAPLRRHRSLSAEEFVYLRARTARIPKMTLPSPGLFANFWSPERSRGAYAALAAFLEDVARILREEVEELAEYGATYIQLDAPHYPLLLDPETRAFYEAQGWSTAEWLNLGVALDNQVMAHIDGVTFGLHLCRGNQGSRWLAAGDYGPIAEPIFRRTAAHRLLLEYDDARSGGFEPLRHVPDDRMVVLGLVTTKRGDLESTDELVARIAEASRHVDRERLALSPQCGFGTSIVGNKLTPEQQAAKLRLVCEVAERVWG